MSKGKKQNTVQIAEELARPVLEEMGLMLWDVRFEKEGADWYLRYFIDKPGGVNIQDCADLSRALDPLLDEADPIDHSYTLEVCSPGIERQFTKDRHFQAYIGHKVTVRLIRPVDGKRDFVGILSAKEGDTVRLSLADGAEMVFLKSEAAYVKLYAEYNTGGLE